MARKALIGIVALLALIFFTSVICPPVHERDGLPDETVGVADTLTEPQTGDVRRTPGADVQRAGEQESPSLAAVRFALRIVDDQDQPLDGVQVSVIMLENEDLTGTRQDALEVNVGISSDGEAMLRAPYPGKFLLRASAEGYLRSELRVEFPRAQEAEPLSIILARAAYLEGAVRDSQGAAVVWGELVLTEQLSGEEKVARARGVGAQFSSQGLAAGDWSIAWREHPHAEIDPRLRFHSPLAPGDRLKLQFTLPARGDQPGTYTVGVERLAD